MRETLLNFCLFIVALLVSVVIITPQGRNKISAALVNHERKVLATMPFSSNGEYYKIIKVSSGNVVSVEIYKLLPSADFSLVALFEMPDSRDVYYDINSAPTNLFMAHLDSDGTQEIVVPTMGRNLESRLNVIKFNAQTKTFAHHTL